MLKDRLESEFHMRRITAFLSTAAGLILFTVLIAHEGVSDILAALTSAGWSLLWVALFHFIPLALDSIGWFSLTTRNNHPSLGAFFWARWVAESFNSLLPVGQVGGHVVRAILIAGRRLPKVKASASVMVDFTIGIATQFIFSLLGGALLFSYLKSMDVMMSLAALVVISFFLLTVFYFGQRKGLFSFGAAFIKKLSGDSRRMIPLVGNAQSLDAEISKIYKRRKDLIICGTWRLTGWLMKGVETMLALHLLGYQATFQEALILESLSNAVASAAFIFPGGLGVREGSILLLGKLLGLPSEIALALALVRRGRELVLGIPGLLLWLASEGPAFFRRHKNA